jgi:uncharacterized protein YkwD
MNKKFLLIAFSALTLAYVGCKKDSSDDKTDDTTTSGGVTDAKEQARKDYNEMYVASEVVGFSWNGAVSGCNPGTLPQDVLDKALLRIKYFRKVAGVQNNTISMEATRNAKSQQNALMIKSNSNISHNPPPSWTCFTAAGKEAAENGNIAIGVSDVENITLWMEDGGTGNESAGHRRWILFSNAAEFGFGSTNTSGSLWVINDIDNWALPAGTPEFIAWPAKGFIPKQLVFPRWSFSVPFGSFPFQVDFTDAVVTMKTEAGTAVNLNIIHREVISNSYAGDNTIVWEPSGIDPDPSSDVKYTVKVAGVKVNGVSKDYEYDVTIFTP